MLQLPEYNSVGPPFTDGGGPRQHGVRAVRRADHQHQRHLRLPGRRETDERPGGRRGGRRGGRAGTLFSSVIRL